MVVQSEEELRRVREGWRLTRDRKGFKMRGPGGRWERISRDLEVVATELYEAQRSERGGRARGRGGCPRKGSDSILRSLVSALTSTGPCCSSP
ncbi:MAG: hypothetical protein RXQ79_05180 [Acidilobus sp.]